MAQKQPPHPPNPARPPHIQASRAQHTAEPIANAGPAHLLPFKPAHLQPGHLKQDKPDHQPHRF